MHRPDSLLKVPLEPKQGSGSSFFGVFMTCVDFAPVLLAVASANTHIWSDYQVLQDEPLRLGDSTGIYYHFSGEKQV
jgi:hypothetical protein